MVQQGRHEGEEGGPAPPEAFVDDRHGQMGLATARLSGEQEPSVGGLGERPGHLEGELESVALLLAGPDLPAELESLEAHTLQHGPLETAHLPQQTAVPEAQGPHHGEPLHLQPRPDALVQPLYRTPYGYHGGKEGVETMVQNLKQLLPGPGGAAVRAQVVQHQHLGIPHLLEEIVVGHPALG